MPRFWTEARVDLIEKARKEGKTFGQIARHFGRPRNAIIGALRRRTHPDARAPKHRRPREGEVIYNRGYSLMMDVDTHAALKARSIATGVSMAELIRTAIEWMLENEDA